MRVVVAIDSFKGSLGSIEAGNAVKVGVLRACPTADVEVCPLADGGEGTVEALVFATGGEMRHVRVTGPLGTPVTASYGLLADRNTAVIEMSAAAGITLVPPEQRDPMQTTTFGVGELIADAIAQGVRRFLVGIGGSATNDGGVGMLQALGFSFLDRDGEQIAHGARGLKELCRIDASGALPALTACEFCIACDVKNPLCGKTGCSAVYGPQKGATQETVAIMDTYLANYASLTRDLFPKADPEAAGAGAAGGMGFAFLAYLDGKLSSGIEMVIRETKLADKLANADVVVTGEGRLDSQTCMGKAPVGVAREAKKQGKTVIAFSGCVSPDASACNDHGIDAFFPILRVPCTTEEAMDQSRAAANLADTAEQVFRLYVACNKTQ